jgi:hypothetical protein
VRTCADGIKICEIPSHDVITSFANAAIKGTTLSLGDSSSFQQSISSLRSSGTRLILVKDNPKYDSYNSTAYATLDPSTIMSQLQQMNTAGQAGGDYTVLQCQVGFAAIEPEESHMTFDVVRELQKPSLLS